MNTDWFFGMLASKCFFLAWQCRADRKLVSQMIPLEVNQMPNQEEQKILIPEIPLDFRKTDGLKR